MKITSILFMILVWALMAPAVYAQSDGSFTKAQGDAAASVNKSHGDDNVGGNAQGDSSGSFKTSGACTSDGKAVANGTASGSDMTASNAFKSQSGANVNSLARSTGEKNLDAVKGDAQQNTWGTKSDGDNFSGGWSSNDGQYNGKIDNKYDPQVKGSATTNGSVQGTLNKTSNGVASTIDSNGSSSAKLTFDGTGKKSGSVSANGSGGAGAMNSIGGGPTDSFFAGAAIDGSASFNASGARSASGSQSMKGSTSTTMTSDTVKATSSMESSVQSSGH